ncbi:MAG: sugar nucleotide-binding protein [Deferrisomatales bacterium]|nr:sugar nucleotide-binding protein [Deferrisomatales bacterium]
MRPHTCQKIQSECFSARSGNRFHSARGGSRTFSAACYTEQDLPAPQSAYGRSKLAGERALLASGLERFLLVRTSWLYGPGGANFVETMVRLARERDELRVVADQVGSPTYTADLAQAIFRLLDGQAPWGVYHFANGGQCSWHGFAEAILAELRQREPVQAGVVRPISTAEYPQPAPRPAYSVLSKDKYRAATGHLPPSWQDALRRYFAARDR